jgi:hypothetical protein
MPEKPPFYTLLTRYGAADLTNAQVFGLHVPITHIAIGDGNGAGVVPTDQATALAHEVLRLPVNSISADSDNPNWLVVEAVIPANVGGWTVRELGLIGGLNTENIADTPNSPENRLLAYGNFPETYKPLLAEGAAKDLVIRMTVQVANTSLVELRIDPAVVVATQKNLAQAVSAHRTDPNAHPGLYAPISHPVDTAAHEDIRALIDDLAQNLSSSGDDVGAALAARIPWLASGAPLPTQDIGPIWHAAYNSIMTWQVFSANGANYAGYASLLVGSPILDAQPTARAGYIASGAANLSKTAYAALWNWAVHHGLLVAAGVWVAGTVRVKDNGNGTFAVYDLREQVDGRAALQGKNIVGEHLGRDGQQQANRISVMLIHEASNSVRCHHRADSSSVCRCQYVPGIAEPDHRHQRPRFHAPKPGTGAPLSRWRSKTATTPEPPCEGSAAHRTDCVLLPSFLACLPRTAVPTWHAQAQPPAILAVARVACGGFLWTVQNRTNRTVWH